MALKNGSSGHQPPDVTWQQMVDAVDAAAATEPAGERLTRQELHTTLRAAFRRLGLTVAGARR